MHVERDPSKGRAAARWSGTSARLELAALAAWGVCGLVLYGTWPDPGEDCGLGARLVVYRARDQGPERLLDGTPGQQGDVLQLAYRVGEPCYGAIVSVDGRGLVTRHLPPEGDHAVKLVPDEIVPLDHAFELDDAPSFERFLLVTGASRFSLGPVELALIAGEALPKALHSDEIELPKPDP